MTSRERHREAPLSRCNCQIPLGRRFHYPTLLLRSLTFNSLYSARQIPRLCALLSDSQLCLSDSSGWEKPLLPRSSLSQATLSHRAQFTGDLWSVTNLGHFWTRLSCHIGRFSLHKNLDGGMCCNRLLNILKKNLVFYLNITLSRNHLNFWIWMVSVYMVANTNRIRYSRPKMDRTQHAEL